MTTKQRVENLLKFSRNARNSDIELLILYMQKSGMELTDRQIEVFKNMPSAETITRIRRKLQEQGKYEADESIQEARYAKMQDYQNEYSDPIKNLARLGYVIAEEN